MHHTTRAVDLIRYKNRTPKKHARPTKRTDRIIVADDLINIVNEAAKEIEGDVRRWRDEEACLASSLIKCSRDRRTWDAVRGGEGVLAGRRISGRARKRAVRQCEVGGVVMYHRKTSQRVESDREVV